MRLIAEDGKVYDTETSDELAQVHGGVEEDWRETLYRSRRGQHQLFLINEQFSDENSITLVSTEQAHAWLTEHKISAAEPYEALGIELEEG